MVTIEGDRVMRDGEKVGYIVGAKIKDGEYKDLGYVEGETIRDAAGEKVAYVEGEYLYGAESRGDYLELEKIAKEVKGGALTAAMRAAVYKLIGP